MNGRTPDHRRRFGRLAVALSVLATAVWSAFALVVARAPIATDPSRHDDPHPYSLWSEASVADLFPPGR